jgi:hypothetical protein
MQKGLGLLVLLLEWSIYGNASTGGAAYSLDCVAPSTHHRIAGATVDFQVRIRTPTGSLAVDTLPSSVVVCGSFDSSPNFVEEAVYRPCEQTCLLRDMGVMQKAADDNEGASFDLFFHLAGFRPDTRHAYTLWLENQGGDDANANAVDHTAVCHNSFESVAFPGWDQLVPKYANATETLRALDEDVLPAFSRVGRPSHAKPSFERLPDLVGPQLEPGIGSSPARTLVATFAGKSSIETINATATLFTSDPRFSFILFAYDRTHWTQFDWVERATVVTVTGTMKWRFARTFLQPSLVEAYEHLVIMDEDVNINGLDVGSFLDDMSVAGVEIGQPANNWGSYFSHEIVRLQPGRGVVWTNFVECGPLVAFDTRAWTCIFEQILFPDITCGHGLDLVWAHCGKTAVLHNHKMIHENLKPASSRPNFPMRCAAEGSVLFERLAHRGITPVVAKEL